MSFWHEGERRVGDLRLPVGAGPHPVVVLVRDDDRPDLAADPRLKAPKGEIVVLVGAPSMDRRPPGASET